MIAGYQIRGALALLLLLGIVLLSLTGCDKGEIAQYSPIRSMLEQYSQQVNVLATQQGLEGQRQAELYDNGVITLTYGYPEPSEDGLSKLLNKLDQQWRIETPNVVMPQGFMTVWIVKHTTQRCGVIYSINTAHPQPPLIKVQCME
ncbi:hypothetical protein ST37_16145 [Vibrio sp. qd031]|uniref:hypothetical protein n=1 Tax=Vibrio sp. qd031 TaxID=1603038 RepID=UPI000A0F4243|nr:hypothetical protein [Vibrio sp. qd031]ORT48916.1 hypothetical protein ST37_16145 [Vibrio sp. qd031]